MKNKFKQTEIGEIPQGWEIKPAEEFCLRVTDGTHDSPQKQSAGKFLVTSRHLKEGHLDFDNAYFISEEDYIEANRRSKVGRWDVIFSMIGTIGEIYLEKNRDINYAIKNVGLFKSGDELKGKWLYYYFQSQQAKRYIHGSRAGTTQEYMTLESLRKFPIIFPFNIHEMRRIIDILDSIQEKIEINHQINKTLESIAQAIFKRWFVDFEFPEKYGKAEDWKKVSLGTLVNFIKGRKPLQTYSENLPGFLPQILIDVLNGGESSFASTDNMVICEQNDILMVMDGASSGRTEIGFSGIIGSTLAKIISQTEQITPAYLYFYLKSKQKEIAENTTGSAIPHADRKRIESMLIALPSQSILEAFTLFTTKVFYQIWENKKQTKILSQIRDSLLPRLMSGKMRVNR